MGYEIKQRLQVGEEILQQWGTKAPPFDVGTQSAKSGDEESGLGAPSNHENEASGRN